MDYGVSSPDHFLWYGLCSTLFQTVLGLSTKRGDARRPEKKMATGLKSLRPAKHNTPQ
jgi:hypothetical protein